MGRPRRQAPSRYRLGDEAGEERARPLRGSRAKRPSDPVLQQPSPRSATVIHAVAGPPDRGRERPGARRRVGLTPEPCDVTILRSLPGVGRSVLATLLAEAFEALQRRDDQALRCLAGVAPVTKRSGKSRIVRMRQTAHVRLRNAVYHWARVAVQHDPRSQAKYAALRARGHGHGRALRSVAGRLIGVACTMLEAKTIFDPNLASRRALNLGKPTC